MRPLIVGFILLFLAAACAQTATPYHQEEPPLVGNAALGRIYAEQTCAQCHAITSSAATSPLPEAPTFDQIANTPGMTRVALNAWLHSPHPSMPHIIVPPDKIDDLSAYLMTLKH